MGLRRSFVQLLLIVSVGSSFIDLPTILDASGIPDCAHTCISDLFHTARQFLLGKRPVDNFRDLCLSYHNASQCIIRRQFEDCFDVTAYDIGMSGLQTLCLGREKELRRYETCLDENFNSVFHQCDQLCMFTKSLSDLSHQKNIRKLAKHGGGYKKFLQEIPYVCSSIGCLSSCIAHQLNEHCPSAGTIIIESLLNPFLRIIHLLNELGVSAKNAVHRQIPPQCYYLINEGKIRNISIGIAPSEEEQQQLKWGLSRINGSALSLVNDSHILRPHNSEIEVQHEVHNSISLDQTLDSSDYSGSSDLVPSTAAVFPSDYNSHDENLIVHELPIDQTLAKSNSFIPVYNTGYDSHDSGESVEIQDSYLDTFPRKVFNGELEIPELTEHEEIIDHSDKLHQPIVHYFDELQEDHELVTNQHSARLPGIHTINKVPSEGHTVFESHDWLIHKKPGNTVREHKVSKRKCMDICRNWLNYGQGPFEDYYKNLDEKELKRRSHQPISSTDQENTEPVVKSIIPHF